MSTRLVMGLLLSTAMTSATYAQNTLNVSEISDADVCARLVTVAESEDTSDSGIDLERAEIISRGDDPVICRDALRLVAGEISADEGAQNFDADAMARIRVAVPEPTVTVDQAAPQVAVEQPTPDVEVTPGRPVVTVNQAEPVVRVQLSPPTITIDMPKPEILVEMPDPTVDVAMAEPRVTVQQGQPEVRVEQGEVQLQIGEQPVDGSAADTAEVRVQHAEAAVQVDDANTANISVADVTPEVRYTAAEPRIEFEESGEPEISFNQSGDPDVRIRRMSAAETRQMTAADTREGEQHDADLGDAEMADAESSAAAKIGTDTRRDSFTIQDLLEKSVLDATGETVGDVENVAARGDTTYVIVGAGGFLGVAERQVALPLDSLQMVGNDLVTTAATHDAIEEMEEARPEEYRPLGTEQDVEIVVQ